MRFHRLRPGVKIQILAAGSDEDAPLWVDYEVTADERPDIRPDGRWVFSARRAGSTGFACPMLVSPSRVRLVPGQREQQKCA